jgi:pimeloyl-ACP methyl ester carboxylesterase
MRPAEAASRSADLLSPCEGEHGFIERPDGTRLHTLVAGHGDPSILLLHGFGVSVDEWNLVQPPLVERGHRVIAYDHRGHGASTVGRDGLGSGQAWDDLAAVLHDFDLHDVVVVCHSMGNFIGIGALGHRPELQVRVRAMVNVAPVTGNASRGAPAAKLQIPLVRTGLLQRLARVHTAGAFLARQNLGSGASPAIIEATRRMLVATPARLAPLAAVFVRESIEPVIGAVEVPMQVIVGTADRLTPVWHAELIARLAPSATVTRLPGVGHMVNWERPEAIVAAVAAAVCS